MLTDIIYERYFKESATAMGIGKGLFKYPLKKFKDFLSMFAIFRSPYKKNRNGVSYFYNNYVKVIQQYSHRQCDRNLGESLFGLLFRCVVHSG